VPLLTGSGDGSFAAGRQFPSITGTYLFAAGFNRAGNLDLLVSSPNSTSVLCLGNGAGGFLPPLTVISGNYSVSAVADVNGDGIPDFIAGGFICNWQVISIFWDTAPPAP